jgi:hypothetical protein
LVPFGDAVSSVEENAMSDVSLENDALSDAPARSGTLPGAEEGSKRVRPAPLFRDRSRPAQIVLGGVVPFLFGGGVGVVLGVSATWYWVLAGVAAVGGVLAGLEHRDGWGGADRGLVGGSLFGLGLLIAHAIAGTEAQVSLGKFPPLLIVIDAFVGILLGAIGGRIARATRRRT